MSEDLSSLSKLLSKFLEEHNVKNEEVTLVVNNKNKDKDNKDNKVNSKDIEILKEFFNENPEYLKEILKDKSAKELAKIIGNDKEEFTNSSFNINTKLHDLLSKYISKGNKDKTEGLKLVNLCNKMSSVDTSINNLKKKVQDQCIHGDDVWGFIMNSNNDHVGIIKTTGKIDEVKNSKSKSKIKTNNKEESSSDPEQEQEQETISDPKPAPSGSSYSGVFELIKKSIGNKHPEKVYLRKPKDQSIFDKIRAYNSKNIMSGSKPNENIVGQVLDKDDKVFGLIVEQNNDRYFVAVKDFGKLSLPIYGIKEN